MDNVALISAEGSPAEPSRRKRRRQAPDELPEWLPDGWFMKVRPRKDGRSDKYYSSPVSGRTFRSEAAVMHYLNFVKYEEDFDELESPEEAFFEDNTNGITTHQVTCFNGFPKLNYSLFTDNALPIQSAPIDFDITFEESQEPDVEDLLGWLPNGWIIEIRARKDDNGRRYKCYLDPVSQFRFYSKEDVLHYVNNGEPCNFTLGWETDESDMITSLIEYIPKGFPAGWIKELKIRFNASGKRKDPYYTDIVSGYVFRTRKDALHFAETGELGKYATKPKTARVVSRLIQTGEASPPHARRSVAAQLLESEIKKCIVVHQDPNPVDKLIDKEPSMEGFVQSLSHCEASGLDNSFLMETDYLKENNPSFEDAHNPHIKENGDCLSNLSPVSSLHEANLLDGRSAETIDKNAPSQTATIANKLVHEKITTSHISARKLKELSRTKTSKLGPLSNPPHKKAAPSKATKQIGTESSVRISKILNPPSLECTKSLSTEQETSKASNQWEFLATAANNLTNPLPFKSSLSKQPANRFHKKLSLRKLLNKTESICENKSIVTNSSSTSMQSKFGNDFVTVTLAREPIKRIELLPEVKQINTSPVGVILEAPPGSSDSSMPKAANKALPLPAIQDTLVHGPRKSDEEKQLELSKLNQPLKLSVVLPVNRVCEMPYKLAEGNLPEPEPGPEMDNLLLSLQLKNNFYSATQMTHVSKLSNKRKFNSKNEKPAPMDEVTIKSPQKSMKNSMEKLLMQMKPIITFPGESTQMVHESARTVPPDHVDKQSHISMISQTENLPESKNDLPQRFGNEGALPADRRQEERRFIMTPQSIEEHMLNRCKATEENSTNLIKDSVPLSTMLDDISCDHISAKGAIGLDNESPFSNMRAASKLEPDKQCFKVEASRRVADGKPRKLRTASLIDETNIIQIPRRIRSPLTRSKCKMQRRTSSRLAGNQPVKPIITYKRRHRRMA